MANDNNLPAQTGNDKFYSHRQITVVIDAEPANRKMRTGVENVVFKLIEKFMEIDGGNPNRHYVLFTKENLRDHWPDLPSNFKHCKLFWPTKYFWAHIRLGLAMRRAKPDVVFIPGNIIPFFTPGSVVTVIHDIVFIEKPEYFTGKTKVAHKLALKRALRKAKLIVTPTNATLKSLKNCFPNTTAQTEVVPWGVDKIFNHEKQETDKEVLQPFDLINKKYFLYIGRLEDKKNTQILIDAFEDVKKENQETELILVGQGDKSINIKSSRLLGYQSNKITSVLYRHAQAFVFPSNYEGFGLPVLEAQASGCPVIASDIPVLQEVGGEAAVYINPKDKTQITRAMKNILTNQGLRSRLSVQGLNHASKYNWHASAKKILNLIVDMA